MSVQIALFAPATRVASRKLGPTAGRRCAPRRAERGAPAWATSTLASTCGRCDTLAIRRSWVSASIAAGRAPSCVEQADAGARRAPPRCRPRGGQVPGRAVEQVLARVLHAGGLGPGERMPADEALVGARVRERALGRADVADHAVRAGARRAPARTTCGERADGRGDEHDVGASRPHQRCRSAARRSRRAPARRARTPRVGVVAAHLARPRARARPGRSSRRSARRRGPRPSRARRDGRAGLAASDGAERLPGERGRALDRRGVLGEVVRTQRLRAVADGLVGVRVHLDDDPVGAGGGRGERQRQTRSRRPRRGSGRRSPAGA